MLGKKKKPEFERERQDDRKYPEKDSFPLDSGLRWPQKLGLLSSLMLVDTE